MSEYKVVISAPIDSYSGYGSRSRDIVKTLIKNYPEWDIRILSQRWGNTREGYLRDHNEIDLQQLIVPGITQSPDIWIQITIPSEFQPVGKYNIGITAGIETTRADISWVEGCNRMSLVLVSSKHSRDILLGSKYIEKTGRAIEVTAPVEILFEGIDPTLYTVLEGDTQLFDLSSIPEKDLLLSVGHWLQGDIYQDRKNLGTTVKTFLETFKNKHGAPALLLKTQGATSSILDRDRILEKIDIIRKTVVGTLPNIYLLHGDLTDKEMNQLYNHSKVKAMVSLTKGEGFGRPLLEFSFVNKPIIASNWSGHLDFLDPNMTTLIPGTLQQVHPTAAVDRMIVRDSSWFTPNTPSISKAYVDLFKSYKKHIVNAKKLGYRNRTSYNIDKMGEKAKGLIDKYMTNLPVKIELELPKLENI
jgi:glycosyltransferase involved in cell wall biosynthesis